MNDRFTQLAFSSAGWSEDQDTRVEPRIEPRVTRAQTWNEDVHRIGRTGRVGNQSRATSIGPPSDKEQHDRPSQGNSFQDCTIRGRKADKNSGVPP